MRADEFKEVEPVVYGKRAVKLLHICILGQGSACFTTHWHERMELLYLRKGDIDLRVSDESFRLSAGQVAIVNSGQLHTGICAAEHVEYEVLMFDLNVFLNDTTAVQQYLTPVLQSYIVFRNVTDQPEVVQAVEDLVSLLQDEQQHPLYAIGQIYRLFGAMCRYCAVEQGPLRTPDKKFGQVLEYINTHYTEHISAGTLSRQFNYSEAYFCRLFKQLTGLTPSAYIRILRLEYAQQLLKQPQLDIADVADRCGFSDTAYFCNCFRKQLSQTPSEFRRRLQSE